MPYTLTMGLLWFAAAFLIGFVTGVLVRSVVARRQIAAARAAGDRAPDAAPDGLPEPRPDTSDQQPDTATAHRLPAAEAVLGHPVEQDDLTAIEGLVPGVDELCWGIGIVTWRDLAETEVSLLRTMLDDAGPRYQVYDPTTWPEQAMMLADGRWDELRDLVATIRTSPSGGPV